MSSLRQLLNLTALQHDQVGINYFDLNQKELSDSISERQFLIIYICGKSNQTTNFQSPKSLSFIAQFFHSSPKVSRIFIMFSLIPYRSMRVTCNNYIIIMNHTLHISTENNGNRTTITYSSRTPIYTEIGLCQNYVKSASKSMKFDILLHRYIRIHHRKLSDDYSARISFRMSSCSDYSTLF